jgi:hypothetical protein
MMDEIRRLLAEFNDWLAQYRLDLITVIIGVAVVSFIAAYTMKVIGDG